MAITIHNRHRILGREWWTTEWAGLSTDDKATIEDVKVNDLFFEEDTGDFYYVESQGSSDTPAVWKKVGSGGSEPESSGEKLFDGDVTTVEEHGVFMYEFSPMVALNYSSIIVEFDGTRYTVQNYGNGVNFYMFGTEMGHPFDEYPFGLMFGDNGNQGLATYIFTESSGTYSLKIWANSEEGEMPVPADPLG